MQNWDNCIFISSSMFCNFFLILSKAQNLMWKTLSPFKKAYLHISGIKLILKYWKKDLAPFLIDIRLFLFCHYQSLVCQIRLYQGLCIECPFLFLFSIHRADPEIKKTFYVSHFICYSLYSYLVLSLFSVVSLHNRLIN